MANKERRKDDKANMKSKKKKSKDRKNDDSCY